MDDMFDTSITGLLAAGFRLYGDERKLERNAISHLHDIYVKMNSLVESDPSVMEAAQRACHQLEIGNHLPPLTTFYLSWP